MRLEGAMREQTMEADRDSDRREQVEDGEQEEVSEVYPSLPQQDDRYEDPDERDDDTRQICDTFSLGHARKVMELIAKSLDLNGGKLQRLCSSM